MLIGIVGAGTMGIGIAQTFAQSDQFKVILTSSCEASVCRGYTSIEKRMMGRVKKGSITLEQAQDIMARIQVGVLEDLYDCDIIVESVAENLALKQEIFRKLEHICKECCIFATNTSSLSITEIGAGISHPVVGMHFFNPAPVMKLVEVIPGLNTTSETLEAIMVLAKTLGKEPVRVKENAGFVVNRILLPMINEAIGLYAEGIATIEGIDSAMKLGANHPMGPLELGDMIGLDVCLAIMEILQAETGDSKYRPHPLLRKMVRGGWLGKKTGRGFYLYTGGEKVVSRND